MSKKKKKRSWASEITGKKDSNTTATQPVYLQGVSVILYFCFYVLTWLLLSQTDHFLPKAGNTATNRSKVSYPRILTTREGLPCFP